MEEKMVAKRSEEGAPNRLLAISLQRPVLVVLILFLVAVIIKILDTMVFRIDELVGEAIVTKAVGFLVVVVAYVSACGRDFRDVGFRGRDAGRAMVVGAVTITGLFLLSHAVQLAVFSAQGEEARLVISAVDPKSGMEGGWSFGLWLILGNLVNSAMEEGLFRGVMLGHLRRRYSPWRAILFQACLFAIWHLNWPIKNWMDGEATLGEAGFEAAALLLSTFISGVLYGYLYHRTGTLWGAFIAHAINNTFTNVLFFGTAEGLQLGMEFGPFLAVWLPGYLLLIPLIGWWARRYRLPESKVWGDFEHELAAVRV